jgi:arylformamidase
MRPTTDPAWAEAQYNNRAHVPDHAAILERWTAASALARAESRCLLDLAYGDGAGETLDLFLPAASAPPAPAAGAPVLVFVHGGYWRALDKADHSFVAPAFTHAGALVVVPNYALAPAVTVEHITLQVARTVAWAWRNARAHGGDPTRLVVAGHSAGGHAATMMLCCRWPELAPDLPARLVTRALSISGLYDLEPLRHAAFLQADLRLTPASVARLSPAFFARPRGTLNAAVGADETDEFRRQNQLIRDVWGPTAVPVCEQVPGTNHFTVLHDLADPAGRTHAMARRLLALA